MNLDVTENPREALWAELVELAQEEADKGDGRALNALHRLRSRMDGRVQPRPLHQDDGC